MANGTNANKGSAYIADAGRWEEEIYQERAVQARRWRNVAFTLMGVILLMGAALAGLIPLKEFRPYVITVDAETGHAEATLVAQTGPLAQDEAVIRSLIGQYVIQRETYDLYDGQQRYNNILELSVGRALNGYRELWKASNPDYPYGRYGDDSIITITVTGGQTFVYAPAEPVMIAPPAAQPFTLHAAVPVAAPVALLSPAPAVVPVESDKRVLRYSYSENKVFDLVGHMGYATTLAFGEKIVAASVGDPLAWAHLHIPTGGPRGIRP